MFLQIYKNIFNNVSPSGFFIITAVPRSLTSVNSVDSVGGLRSLTICADLCNLWENIRSKWFCVIRGFCGRTHAKGQKKRTTRITRTGLSKNNVTLIILNHAKTAIGPKNNNIIFTLKSIKLLT